ncbi:hypothetical protein R9208_29660, partial [Flammeovirgaceae bacterium SG7u.132]|nr:hypothetical protein [Flammeovirgaceae bacterium SG7u.132]
GDRWGEREGGRREMERGEGPKRGLEREDESGMDIKMELEGERQSEEERHRKIKVERERECKGRYGESVCISQGEIKRQRRRDR